MSVPWLTILIALPLLGRSRSCCCHEAAALPKQVAFGVSLVVLALSVVMAAQFDADDGFQFVESTSGSRRSALTTPSASTAWVWCWCCSRRS